MNLWLLGWRAEGRVEAATAVEALRGLLARAGFLDPETVEGWTAPSGRAAAAWASHPAEQTGGVRYVDAHESRIALFAGRPIRWTGEHAAEGRGPLDPAFYARPASAWADTLDGRWAAARYDDAEGELEAASDAVGAYPLYRTEGGGTLWLGTNAEALHLVSDDDGWDVETLASILGGGRSLSGNPWWRAVRRLGRGVVLRRQPGEPERTRELLPSEAVARLPGGGFDAFDHGRLLVASLEALSDWPGRPVLVPITGGRDSRLVFAAALHADVDWKAVTHGHTGLPDVDLAREVCAAAGVEHHLVEHDPHGNMLERPRRVAQVVALSGAGTATAADAIGFPLGPRDRVLPLWHSGHGSEVGRAVYGIGSGMNREGLIEHLHRRFTTRRPGRAELIDRRGAAIVRRLLAAFVDEQLGYGAAPVDVPDLYFFHVHMARWAGPSHSCVEWIRDTTSPTWSPRLLPHELGLPARERALHLFHLRATEALAPQIVDVPFEGDRPWPARQSALTRRTHRARTLARKALAEGRRRAPAGPTRSARSVARGTGAGGRTRPVKLRRLAAPAPGAPGPDPIPAPDPFAAVQSAVREQALAEPGQAAWEVLDRGRIEALLTREPATLDPMARAYVWRLATVFLRDGGD
jgi:hypothetical protein